MSARNEIITGWAMRAIFCPMVLGLAVLAGCGGGGNSSVTTITGGGQTAPTSGPELSVDFVQKENNLPVTVDGGPAGIFSLGSANILYASVTICEPGSQTHCQTIDHLQVDTGSVGLRVLASKVKTLGLPMVEVGAAPAGGKPDLAVECYPFVIGGLWGPNAVADIRLGQQLAAAVPVQLIDDDPKSALGAPLDCYNAVNGQILNSSHALASNGILGIGSVKLDCGLNCSLGDYRGTFVQYYRCPADATSSLACTATAMPVNLQVFNPVAALPRDNNGVVLTLPSVTGLGASKVSGELIFGINTQPNNTLAGGANRINLGVQYVSNPDSYLGVSTYYKNQLIANSYLDTGTNAVFFTDPSIAHCSGSTWYCPATALTQTAIIADGDRPLLHQTSVDFTVGNSDALFSTTNVAFGQLAGVGASASAPAFSWGLPFFYGRKVYMSIWQQVGSEQGPWYSF